MNYMPILLPVQNKFGPHEFTNTNWQHRLLSYEDNSGNRGDAPLTAFYSCNWWRNVHHEVKFPFGLLSTRFGEHHVSPKIQRN